MKDFKNPQKIQFRTFRCTQCDSVMTAPKRRGKTAQGHFKNMWCYSCKAKRVFVQVE